MTIKFTTAAAVFAAFALSNMAHAETYLCKFSDPAKRGIIPGEVLVEFSAADAANVTDPILLHFQQAPKAAKRAKNTSKMMRASWRLDDFIDGIGNKADIDYGLTFNKNRKRANINITVHGYANTETGSGNCALQ